MLTFTLTVLGGTLVYVLGQFVMRAFIDPVLQVRQEIGRIVSALAQYEDLYANPGPERRRDNPDRFDKAKYLLREKFAEWQTAVSCLPFYDLWAKLGMIPSVNQAHDVMRGLVGLHNTMEHNAPMQNIARLQSIRMALGVKLEDYMPSEMVDQLVDAEQRNRR